MNNFSKGIVTLALVITGSTIAISYEGDTVPAQVGQHVKITYAEDGSIRYKNGSFIYHLNTPEDLFNFAYTKDKDDDDNIIFARKVIEKMLETDSISSVIDKLEEGLQVSIVEELQINP